MKLILLRHATRSPSPSGNKHLNTRGKAQADDLYRAVQSGILPKPTKVLTSPKYRAIETVARLSDFLATTAQAAPDQNGDTYKTIQIDERLDERSRDESADAMANRIRSLIEEIERQSENRSSVVYLCSHMDWLETACVIVNSDLPNEMAEEIFNTCEVRLFEWDAGLWKFLSRRMF